MKLTTRTLAEGGLSVALTMLLGMIVFWKMPQGGSIHAAHMVPLLFFALRRGTKAGILAGVVYGALHFLIGAKYSLHPLSIFLDYVFAYGALGLAGLAGADSTRMQGVLAAIGAMLARIALTIVSGAVVFGSYAPEGMNPWIYSFGYNMTTMVPDLVLNAIVLWLLFAKVMKMPR